MKRIIVPLLFSCFIASHAVASLENSSAVSRSRATGGAFVSLADDASAIFVNPAGVFPAAPFAAYFDYAEPAEIGGARESRLAVTARGSAMRFGLGWYRFETHEGSDNLYVLNAARLLVEGSQGSFISIGANVVVGSTACGRSCRDEADSWSGMTGDVGLIVRPLPVISLAYAAGNVRGVHPDDESGGEPWRLAQRWGASYFWEDRIIISFAGERIAERATFHYGLSVRTAVPIELMAGFSDGHATGGIRWNGSRYRAVVAFSADEARHVTWAAGFEMRIRRDANGGEQ
jgi:hypothetical protein